MQCPECSAPLSQYTDLENCNRCRYEKTPRGVIHGFMFNQLMLASPSAPVARISVPKSDAKRTAAQKPYRSPLKRQVRATLIQHPSATNLELCRKLDEEGFELPEKYQKLVYPERSFEAGYRHPVVKRYLEIIFSKVRRDLRVSGQI